MKFEPRPLMQSSLQSRWLTETYRLPNERTKLYKRERGADDREKCRELVAGRH